MDLLWIIENQISKNSRNEHFRESLQIISKSCNLYINRKLRTRGFQRD